VACQQAVGARSSISIFGTDYPTPDGTGVRDYIHVEDLASAHLSALDYLRSGGESTTFNCGYGHGYSVREVLSMVEKVNGRPLDVIEGPRRTGDPPSLVAHAESIRRRLGWTPRLDDLEVIVRTQLEWERRLMKEPQLQRN
jgi:UDP-glucose 4-epimerase